MYHPMQNQWRSNQALQSSNQTTQPEASNNNPHNSQAKQENSPPSTSVMNNNVVIPSRGRILTISGGNSMEHESNSKKSNYFKRVDSISKGPFKKTRWSHFPITFLEEDLQLKDYPHMDAMVIEANIDGWSVSKILVDGGSSVDIIFTSIIDAIKIDHRLLGRV